ncbi:polyamine transporter 1 [Verticillium dahliae]|uniref:Major facilitator superfamily (MFS) profile domain-containing protein n=3 Tax=Verticillium dahliae TaxID=27337 RepID=A0AA45AMN5_VERDA|nr:Phosducin-like protein [Verticillium dahliae VDG2]KAH6699309.1 polyamine transporter 1 [Verticillium dahliae]PNH32665.1 hypothetical protein BJF96_g4056 [Verticillium dahliae]PNH57793.1 hypothetical protein VD0003_g39 [Verticillium dahliae]
MPRRAQILYPQAAVPYASRDIQEATPPLGPNNYVDFRLHDPENPRNFSVGRKWYITIVVVLLATNGNYASSLPSGSLVSLSESFGVSEYVAGLSITVFLLGFCAGPFIFAPLSEFYGRRVVLFATSPIYMAFTFLCAFPPSFASLLVGRFLAGTFIAASISIAPGVLADLWEPDERGNATAVFSLFSWVGPSVGPIVSGFCELKKDWRWAFYTALWFWAAAAIPMLTLPETHAPTIQSQKARCIRAAKIPGYENVTSYAEATSPSLLGIYKIALTRPWCLLIDPISTACAIYMAFVFTLYYMLFSIYPIVFQDMRGWNSGVGQLPLMGSVLGAGLGAVIVSLDTRRRMCRSKSREELPPEDRLLMAMIGGVGFPITMFWFAWTGQFNSIHWSVPTIAGVFLSASLLLIFVALTNYLLDTYQHLASSAVAANIFARSLGSATAPLFTSFMFEALDVGGGGSLIAGVAVLLAPVPFIFYRYGSRIRARSKYVPTGATETAHLYSAA